MKEAPEFEREGILAIVTEFTPVPNRNCKESMVPYF